MSFVFRPTLLTKIGPYMRGRRLRSKESSRRQEAKNSDWLNSINPKMNFSNFRRDWKMRALCFLHESNFLNVVHILGILQFNGMLGLLLVEINVFSFN
jgi:hypothetical protein